MFSIFNAYQKSFRVLVMTGMSLLLLACGSGGGASDSAVNTATTTIEGNAVKGVIENGLVRAFLVQDQAGTMIKSTLPIGAAARTDAFGAYKLILPGTFSNRTLVIEVTADFQTRMTCDVIDGCGVDGSNAQIAYGDKFALGSDFLLTAAVTSVDTGETISSHLSPLSHMAVAYAMSGQNGLTAANISGALSQVETMMDLDQGALALSPADITRLESYSSLSKSELEMGVISAAFLSLVNTPDWDSIEEILTHVASQMEVSGGLAAVNMGALRDVTLDDLFFNANAIVQDIVQAEPESTYMEALTVVSAETSESYQNVSDAPPEVDPVQFVSHPQSTTVNEGEQVQFSVVVTGGGTILFQWRKDGVEIAGATASSLTVSIAALADVGTYDVIVSNSVGSLTSFSALLAVNETGGSGGETQLASVELSWDIPLQREDGSALELFEINGYVITYGTTSGNLDSTVAITGGGQTSTFIEQLATNTWYFAIATVDSDGVQGAFSPEIQQVLL